MISQVRAMILNEQRQLTTLGYAMLVFMMTLFAQRLQAEYSKFRVVGAVGDRHASHTSRNNRVKNHRDPMIALAAPPLAPR
jgi:hypothetical protein